MTFKIKEEKKDRIKGNSILNNAKYSADNTDEWYTTYETIDEEIIHYKKQFKNKIVLCNCDDPYLSNFCYYFLRHFNQLELKKLRDQEIDIKNKILNLNNLIVFISFFCFFMFNLCSMK